MHNRLNTLDICLDITCQTNTHIPYFIHTDSNYNVTITSTLFVAPLECVAMDRSPPPAMAGRKLLRRIQNLVVLAVVCRCGLRQERVVCVRFLSQVVADCVRNEASEHVQYTGVALYHLILSTRSSPVKQLILIARSTSIHDCRNVSAPWHLSLAYWSITNLPCGEPPVCCAHHALLSSFFAEVPYRMAIGLCGLGTYRLAAIERLLSPLADWNQWIQGMCSGIVAVPISIVLVPVCAFPVH